MTKQKKGFLLFISSLFPGAGELYMGFKKQGLSIMLLFWGSIAIASYTGIDFLLMFLPVLWAYSFFNVHNLKSLSEEEFYQVEDSCILNLDQFIDNTDHVVRKYQKMLAALLIIFGISILWNNLVDMLLLILPSQIARFLNIIFYRLPTIVIALLIVAAGVHLLKNKKQEYEQEKEKQEQNEEHYWAPYRPCHQPDTPEKNTDDSEITASETESANAEESLKTLPDETN